MEIEAALLTSQILRFEFSDYVRIIPTNFQATPLGCDVGDSRFGGTVQRFATLYAAKDLATGLAETLIRDRFEGISERRLFISQLSTKCAVSISSTEALHLIDLRKGGCLKLGVSTDIAGAKCFDEAQAFSDMLYQNLSIDGILYASRLTGENCIAIFDRAIKSHLSAKEVAPLVQLIGAVEALQTLNVQLIL
mgnify:CR=1 FL=1|tara:strand:- start:1807 stop:2385 length:579 start_codon:yes stop_codon:yes gene_type:complete